MNIRFIVLVVRKNNDSTGSGSLVLVVRKNNDSTGSGSLVGKNNQEKIYDGQWWAGGGDPQNIIVQETAMV